MVENIEVSTQLQDKVEKTEILTSKHLLILNLRTGWKIQGLVLSSVYLTLEHGRKCQGKSDQVVTQP